MRFSCEAGEAAGDDYAAAEEQVLYAIRRAAGAPALLEELRPPDPWPDAPAGQRLGAGLTAGRWREAGLAAGGGRAEGLAPRAAGPARHGLRQLDDYLHRLDLDHGTLVLFDRRPEATPIANRTTFAEGRTPSGRPTTVLRA